MPQTQLGHVPSLFPHIKDEWWKDSYDEIFLWTDGDCVEDPALTDAECTTLLQLPKVSALFAATNSPNADVTTNSSGIGIQVLDLCCGQGRHTNTLAAQFPFATFHGLDQSTYLLDLARQRAKNENVDRNTLYTTGDARAIPAPNGSYDLVFLLGNSFGHGSHDDDRRLLRETARVLKPDGVFVIDFVDGGWMRENVSAAAWEWLNSDRFIPAPGRHGGKNKDEEERKLVALRERELSPDKKRLASREIVVDLAAPRVYQDLFYAVQLYDGVEMEGMFGEVGLRMLEGIGITTSTSEDASAGARAGAGAAGDQGMMGHRQLLVAWKDSSSLSTSPPAACVDPQDADTYVHPHITLDYEEGKGRLLRATAAIDADTVVIADAPYAIVPTVPPDSNEALICSNLLCRRRVPQDAEGVRCADNCINDVIWCNSHCRKIDQARHDFECAWLKKYGTRLRQEEGEEDFAMLWIIARMLAGRDLELRIKSTNPDSQQDKLDLPWSNRFKRGWDAGIDNLLGNRERWPQERLQHWADLVERYLSDEDQPGLLSPDDVLTLICKEETNTFGLYTVNTGPPETQKERGASYGLACYPRATICNHSCLPNLKHGPDDRGRMVMTTTRDIAAGEECFIAYIDLSVHKSLEARQKRIMHYFTFSCVCDRCLQERAETDIDRS
ncbi:uncharacterized protein APUU_70554A [Aspergillus puulaauensis]|uniref:SET domain-containing protein n=1 Tax=Aspergillus puulaauensis TaxID=1220207 RepID=A0A7R7XWX6_9EURO|nr:uncharacterized protein APUU_70554A [Aspergillus puulaauensis]BCS28984.1 hypothetical protein APUU_70554A [Aspergillus puulaauensis]